MRLVPLATIYGFDISLEGGCKCTSLSRLLKQSTVPNGAKVLTIGTKLLINYYKIRMQ